ncbi:MAG TPA: NmrA family NAD(P)-binding protein [Solirubrobacterales bacterium]|nr:NmrA family NAD(P)-binding protein [Solirubrobacterales bacterium]
MTDEFNPPHRLDPRSHRTLRRDRRAPPRARSPSAGARDLDSPSATRLRELGARPIRADFDDPATLEVAGAGVDAAFASGTAHRSGPDGEAQHARNLVAAALEAEVPHIIFVSADGAASDSPLPLFRAKWEVEETIRASGVPHTVLAPTYLMENLWHTYGEWARTQLDRFRELCPHPEPVAG